MQDENKVQLVETKMFRTLPVGLALNNETRVISHTKSGQGPAQIHPLECFVKHLKNLFIRHEVKYGNRHSESST